MVSVHLDCQALLHARNRQVVALPNSAVTSSTENAVILGTTTKAPSQRDWPRFAGQPTSSPTGAVTAAGRRADHLLSGRRNEL